jgi:hypothetical protein
LTLALRKKTFETTCTKCHKLSNVEKSPPATTQDARDLVARMVDNGLEAPPEDLQQIVFYLTKKYAK